jgi:uncharacterized protein (TIGR02145 family)
MHSSCNPSEKSCSAEVWKDYLREQSSVDIIRDIDGNQYGALVLGSQKWLDRDLITIRYRNGDRIQGLDSGSVKAIHKSPVFPKEGSFGLIYPISSVQDPRGICPKGWRVATVRDWNILSDFAGGDDSAFVLLMNGVEQEKVFSNAIGSNGSQNIFHPLVWWEDQKHKSGSASNRSYFRAFPKSKWQAGNFSMGVPCRCIKDEIRTSDFYLPWREISQYSALFRTEENISADEVYSRIISGGIACTNPARLIWDKRKRIYWVLIAGNAIQNLGGVGVLGINARNLHHAKVFQKRKSGFYLAGQTGKIGMSGTHRVLFGSAKVIVSLEGAEPILLVRMAMGQGGQFTGLDLADYSSSLEKVNLSQMISGLYLGVFFTLIPLSFFLLFYFREHSLLKYFLQINSLRDFGPDYKQATPNTCTLPSGTVLNLSGVVFAKSEGNYVYFKVIDKDKPLVERFRLKHFIVELYEFGFVQSHKSYVVNLAFVEKVEADEILLAQDLRIPLSRHFKNFFLTEYGHWVSNNLEHQDAS